MSKEIEKNQTKGAALPDKSEVAKKEESILKFWDEKDIFKKTLDKPSPNGNFVFYDGPPFATGLPHYGHVLSGTIKDVVPRYQTMKGKFVRRRWGWDSHGLPVENLIQKELNVQTKEDIENIGVDVFNQAARDSVLRYYGEWKRIIPRTGRFVDMENFYMTMSCGYTESVWWSFKNLWDKNLAYEGFKSMHISPLLETPLSNFEVNLDYRDITDISVYVKFALTDTPDVFLLAWTTTPWTLFGNVALAVGKGVEYVQVAVEGVQLILAKSRLDSVLKGKEYEIVKEVVAEELAGKSYVPVFDHYATQKELEHRENGWKVCLADFVTTEDGTGIVHIAPAFGEDDLELGREQNLPFVQHVSIDGSIKEEVSELVGKQAKPMATAEKPNAHQETDIEVIKMLAAKGVLFAKEKIVHSYPHCWRTGAPLLNYAMSSWYVKVSDLREKMLSENNSVHWVPTSVGRERFGNWLEGAKDWSVSRSRYWGTTMPVWKSEDGEDIEVIGSIKELKEKIKSTNTYYGIRHGEAKSNVDLTVTSALGEINPMTEKGKQQVADVLSQIKEKNIDVIIASDIYRTRQTAEIIAKELGGSLDAIVYDARLREFSFGEYEGKKLEEYRAYYSSYRERYEKRLPNGESYTDVKKRVGEFMYEVNSAYKGKNILIISHSTPLWLMHSVAEGVDTRMQHEPHKGDYFIKNAELIEIDFAPLPHTADYDIDLHRPYIDEVTWVNEKGKLMKRIADVFDTWYDSGAMPFASVHYPFEDKEEFEKKGSILFPADFIAEGIDQTRGWFYTLLVLGVAHFNTTPFKNVVSNGMILAEDGKKMSKSLKNYPDLMGVVNKYGADSLRYYLMSSPAVRGEALAFSEKGVDEIMKKIVLRLKNVVSFYKMYGEASCEAGRDSVHVLDKWIIARTDELIEKVTGALDAYELDRACRPFLDFVDDLSTWYIRRSRDRYKSVDETDRQNAIATTRFVLCEVSKVLAPFMPFLAEEIYLQTVGVEGKESVHLEDWPSGQGTDVQLLEDMRSARETVSLALEARAKAGIKIRQPLGLLEAPGTFSAELRQIIADEINVKEVKSGDALRLDTAMTPELEEEGVVRNFIRAIQDLRKKRGLSPEDVVTLYVSTSKEIQDLIERNKVMISAPTNSKDIVFKNTEGEVVSLGNVDVVFTITT